MIGEGSRVMIIGTNFRNVDYLKGEVAYVRTDGDLLVRPDRERYLIHVGPHQVRPLRRHWWWPW